MNKFKRELAILAVLLVVMSAISIYFYGELKATGVEKVPIHWNVHNEPDNFATPWLACLIGPAVIGLIMIATASMSRKNYSDSEIKTVRFVILLIASVMVFLNWVALKSALGYSSGGAFDLSMLHLGLGLLFVLIGNQFGKMPYSRWIGIRVPATLGNEEVWNRVHRRSGRFMVLSGVSMIVAAFVGNAPWVWVFYLPLFVSLIIMIFILPAVVKKQVESEAGSKNN